VHHHPLTTLHPAARPPPPPHAHMPMHAPPPLPSLHNTLHSPHPPHLHALCLQRLCCCAIGVPADSNQLRGGQPTSEQTIQRTPRRGWGGGEGGG
jgi:hypothetical protein